LWISNLSLSIDNHFKGIVGNDPVYVKNIKMGDTVSVETENISDWMIIDNGKLLGGFTIYVLRNNLSENERKQFDAEKGFEMGNEPSLP
jgi:uncharacterized protein YegJ (DUF2314 family)